MARAVRIARGTAPAPGSSDRSGDGYRSNTAGLTRSGRLFGSFALVLGLTYVVFVALLVASPAGAGTAVAPTLEFLSLAGVLLIAVAFLLTLGRTPRGIDRAAGRLVVVEFLGARRTFVVDGSFRRTVENRYPAGLLAPEPTEMVALASARGPSRHYLVARDLIPEVGP